MAAFVAKQMVGNKLNAVKGRIMIISQFPDMNQNPQEFTIKCKFLLKKVKNNFCIKLRQEY